MTVTSSFQIDGVWYEMGYGTLMWIEQKIGGKPTNRQIVEYIHDNLPIFSITECNPTGILFVYVALK